MRGPKPNYEKDTKVKILREKYHKKFREIAEEMEEDVKTTHVRYRRSGGKLVGRL
jgi:hypothetical protein